MEMSDHEILRAYREAKEKGYQVQILAQLNDCTTEQIKKILEAQGEKVTVTKRLSGRKRSPEKKDAEKKESGSYASLELPEAVKATLFDRMDVLGSEILGLSGQLEEKREEFRVIERFLRGGAT